MLPPDEIKNYHSLFWKRNTKAEQPVRECEILQFGYDINTLGTGTFHLRNTDHARTLHFDTVEVQLALDKTLLPLKSETDEGRLCIVESKYKLKPIWRKIPKKLQFFNQPI